MADKSSQLVLTALTRATADAAGVPLHGSKTMPGLFPATTVGKQAALRCQEDGFLRPIATDANSEPPRGRGQSGPVCTITEKGIAYLLSQVSPRQVLEDFVRVLEAREEQVSQLMNCTRQVQMNLEALRASIAPVLAEVIRSPFPTRPAANGELNGMFQEFHHEQRDKSSVTPSTALMGHLGRWAQSGASEDCPLPDLYRQAQAACPGASIGEFHDALRTLQNSGAIYLHPWTGPLYDIPEPPYALLVGHEIAYYASLRNPENPARNPEE